MAIFHVLATLYLISHAGAIVMKRPTTGETPNVTDKGTFELLILHNNDMHARFEQTSQLSGTCTPADRDAGKCYGGFPRVAYVVKQARAAAAAGEGPPVLYLNAGDTYTGTAWFTIYKWKIAAEFINALQPDAVALGNHEFDAQTHKFSPFLRSINHNILATNILFNSPEAKINLHRSIIFDIDGAKVGVVSYLTPDKTMLDIEGNIEYINEVLAVRSEANKLKNEGVNIVIALGHSESPIDIEIAKEIVEIDLVISATKNVFLWNGKTVNEELHEPVVVTQASGKMVPIISSTAYNKYLGQLVVTFDSDGEIVKYENIPVLLDETIEQDSDIINILEKHQKDMVQFDDEIVGVTSVVLDGASCRLEECNFGNLITDAMIYYYALRFEGDNWTDAPIAVIPTGTIAGSIAPSDRPAAITKNDLLQALPTESHLVAVEMNGVAFLQMLEAAVADYGPTNAAANFLQFSGVRVVYDLERAPGSRVVSVVARCWSCFVPEYYTIDSWRTYKTLMPASLARSTTGFAFLEDIPKDELAYDEVTCLEEYIGMRSPVYPDVAGRITILNAPAIEDEVILEPESPVLETPSASSASVMSFTIKLITLAVLGQIQYFI